MSGRGHDGLGFGGMFGRGLGGGVAIVMIIAVIALGHALGHQLTHDMSLVLTFAMVALCTLLGGVVLVVLGWLAYRAQLARLTIAERRAELESGSRWAARAEVEHEAVRGGQLTRGSRWAVRAGGERHAETRRLERGPRWRAEVIEGGEAEALEGRHEALSPKTEAAVRPAIQGNRLGNLPRRHLEALPGPPDWYDAS
jgi:hypothetical protein